jgi:hypothetical protein
MLTAVAMYAVPERAQAIAQVFGKLMHFWAACLGIGFCLCMMSWRVQKATTNHLKRSCFSFVDQLLFLLVRLTQPLRAGY